MQCRPSSWVQIKNVIWTNKLYTDKWKQTSRGSFHSAGEIFTQSEVFPGSALTINSTIKHSVMMHFRWMSALLKISWSLPLLLRTADAKGSARHCVEEGRKHINICVSFSTEANSTTEGTDVRLTFEHQRYSTGGWTAVGLGSGMYGALMLIAYTGTDGGHIEPRPFESLPEMAISAVSINESRWFTSTLTCYTCDEWVQTDQGTSAQPFVWATNPSEPRDGASADAQLPMHRHKGHFTLDPSKDQGKGESLDGDTGSKKPVHTETAMGDATVPSSAPKPSARIVVLMILAIMLLFPAAALWAADASEKGSESCRAAQVVATLPTFMMAEICFGNWIVAMAVFRMVLAYFSHQRSTENLAKLQRILDSCIIVGGAINTFVIIDTGVDLCGGCRYIGWPGGGVLDRRSTAPM
ncbi:hypothetical protein MY3296_009504 [Beauveria thailandica]